MLQTQNIRHLAWLHFLTTLLVLVVCTSASAQQELVWNPLPVDRTVYLELEEGTVVIELNPDFAPKTVEHLKSLMAEQYYRGRSFYRVIDGFMAQAGADPDTPDDPDQPELKAEFEIDWPIKPAGKVDVVAKARGKARVKAAVEAEGRAGIDDGADDGVGRGVDDGVDDGAGDGPDAGDEAKEWTEMSWTPVQENDLYAPFTGFVDGFAVGRDQQKNGKAWLLHCPGSVAMARGIEPDSGYAEFYIVIGQAPRYLDRNMTVFGRVVWGMDVVQRIKRGPPLEDGIIEGDLDRSWIKRMRLASTLDKKDQLNIWIADSNDKTFVKMLEQRRDRKNKFFHHPPPKVLDICQVPVPSRLEKPDAKVRLKYLKY